MIAKSVKKVTRTIFPKGSAVDEKLKFAAVKMRVIPPPIDMRYHAWMIQKEPNLFKPIADKDKQFLITIVTPAFNTPDKYLQPLLYSIINQTYDNFEWIIADASEIHERSDAISELEQVDERIKVIKTSNKGIAENTNTVLKKAKGDYIVFIDHDDTLAHEALNEVYHAASETGADVIYSDEDKLIETGHQRRLPHLKPDFSLDLLRNLNYITHLMVLKRSFLESVGYLDSRFDGAQDYELMLRSADAGAKFTHIPRILYHWREADASTASDFQVKSYVLDAGVTALKEHLERNSIYGDVEAMEGKPGFYRIRYQNKGSKISLFKTNSKASDVVIGDSFISSGSGDYTLIQTADVGAADNWEQTLSSVLDQNKDIGIVCPVILNPSLQVVDAGQINSIDSQLFYGVDFAANTYFGDSDWVRNLNVPSRVFLVRSELLEDFGRNKTKFDIDKFTKFVSSKDLRITLFSYDPWVENGHHIKSEDQALISDMSVFKGYKK